MTYCATPEMGQDTHDVIPTDDPSTALRAGFQRSGGTSPKNPEGFLGIARNDK